MRTLLTAAAFAVLAIVLVEVSVSEARGWGFRCEDHKPPLNTTEDIRCDRFPHLFRLFRCIITCRSCYSSDELIDGPGACLVKRKCTCLGNPTDPTTTETPSTEPPTTEPPTTTGPTEDTTTQESEPTTQEPEPTTTQEPEPTNGPMIG